MLLGLCSVGQIKEELRLLVSITCSGGCHALLLSLNGALDLCRGNYANWRCAASISCMACLAHMRCGVTA